MNKTRKANLLYQQAHGQEINVKPEERSELKKYRVCADDGNYSTRANIDAYIKAVDGGYRLSFYDWCMNNHKADRRRKGSSEREMAANNRDNAIGAMFLGWLVWGLAVYWIFHGSLSAGVCAILGAVVSVILLRLNRQLVGFTLIILPIILIVVFGR